MKKVKAVLAAVVVLLVSCMNCTVVQAAEQGLTVHAGEVTERTLSETEISALSNELLQMGRIEEADAVLTSTDSYVTHRYSQTFEFYDGDTWVAAVDAACIVYRYTDGKVHLYSREFGLRKLDSYSIRKTYGRIVNTDGSVSYTTGDRVTISDDVYTWEYAIDFAATATGQSFTCYKITY